MFGKQTLYTSLIVSCIALLWLAKVAYMRPSDIEAYRAYTKKSRELASSQAVKTAEQKRQEVRKDIWFAEETGAQLHTRIDSQASTLVLLPKDDKVDIIENLEGIRCWMQDRLFVNGSIPMQQTRYFEAGTGTYQYTTQRFIAKSVEMSLFRMPGHALAYSLDPESAFLKGVASDVTFAVSGKSPQFQAEHFQALIKPHNEESRR